MEDLESVENVKNTEWSQQTNRNEELIQSMQADSSESLHQIRPATLRRSLRLIQKKIAQEAQADLIMVNSSSEGASQRRKKKRKRKSTSVKTKRFRDKSTQTLNSVELDEIGRPF